MGGSLGVLFVRPPMESTSSHELILDDEGGDGNESLPRKDLRFPSHIGARFRPSKGSVLPFKRVAI